MYLHIGGDIVVKIKDIVAIMDMEKSSTSRITQDFLRQKKNEVISVNDELPKSYVIINKTGKTVLYISPISPQTLLKRANNIKEYFKLPQFK